MSHVEIAADQITYEDLYVRWEQGNWRASEIDFSVDLEQWRSDFSELDRRAALWTYAMFFHGEDAVADALSPFIDAAPREEQKYFLATQQVDEARHAVMFGRFMREVAGAGKDMASSLQATSAGLTWGFTKVFARLDRMADELRRDRSRTKLAQAIMLYHVVIEAALAQPGQHFIEESLTQRDQLPGLREGIGNVTRDEQRHIAFGVKMIADLVREDPECEDAIAELLREILPFTSAVFIPPDWDERYVTTFGFTLQDIYTHGADAIEMRLRAAGLRPEEMRIGLPFDIPNEERARRVLKLLHAGYLGPPNGPVSADPEATAIMFDGLRRQVDSKVAPGARIQFGFTDAEPWHLQIENGSASVGPGSIADPDLVLSCKFADWLDVAAGRTDPMRALLLRKLRPSGKLRMLVRARKLLG